jgi:hypothetical protein
MGKFKLSEYEQVDDRIKQFYDDHPEGSIVTKDVGSGPDSGFFKAYIYRNAEEQVKDTPWATGHAWEDRIEELSVSKSGKKYEDVNYSSWIENCETSAIGRALANAGYMKNKRPSRQEMQKVNRYNKRKSKAPEGTQIKCEDCSTILSEDEISWCKSFYDGMYCKKCQKDHKKKKK